MSRRTCRTMRTPKYEQPAFTAAARERPATRPHPCGRRSDRTDGGSDPGRSPSWGWWTSNHRRSMWSIPIVATLEAVLAAHGAGGQPEGDPPLHDEEEDDRGDRRQRRAGHERARVGAPTRPVEVREPDEGRLLGLAGEDDSRVEV